MAVSGGMEKKSQSDTGSRRVFYSLQLHLLQLAVGLPSKATCCCQLNVAAMLVWVSFGSVCLCGCVTSHRDALVLHSLSPSLVIKDSLDLVNVLCKTEGECKNRYWATALSTLGESWNYTYQAWVFFCSPYSVTFFWLPNWDSDVIVNRFSEILH